MGRQNTWVDGRVDVLLAALQKLGLSVSRAAAVDLIHERVRWVSSQVGISPVAARRYLTDESLDGLAETMAFSLVEETPGADLLDAPRTVGVPLALIGRCIAGLAEAVQVRLRELDDVDHIRVTVAQLAHALSAIGQLTAAVSDSGRSGGAAGPVVVMLPPGLVHRAARYLDAAATMVAAGVLPEGVPPVEADQLAASFRHDATGLRSCAMT
jgi:hypothetical protein